MSAVLLRQAEHEDAVGEALQRLKIPVSLSSQVLAEYREYERTSTTVINAYLAPLMGEYLTRLGGRLKNTRVRVMQSNGGAVRARTAAELPVHTIVSGPAGGVVGAFHVASGCGYSNVITFDMGGTSTDVALCEGQHSVSLMRRRSMDCPSGFPSSTSIPSAPAAAPLPELDAVARSKSGPQARARNLARSATEREANVSQ